MKPRKEPAGQESVLPLSLVQVLEEEFEAVHGVSPGQPSWLLDRDQVTDPRSLCIALGDDSNPVSRHLRSILPETIASRLDAAAEALESDPAFPDALLDGLNAVLQSTDFCAPERFERVRLRRSTRMLLDRPLSGQDLVRVNRLLLEEAYPESILPIREVRLRRLYREVHGLGRSGDARPRTALCISGGGIRSATFALGIIQGLARLRLLDKFDYISTVSGGGYIGSWLTAWIARQSLPHVLQSLSAGPRSRVQPEPHELRHLRAYSNYLSPRLGLFSADTWTLATTFVRNMILNWLLLVPILALLLLFPRLYLLPIRLQSPDWAIQLLLALAFLLGAAGITYVELDLPSGGGKRWSQGRFLRRCLLPLCMAAILLTVYWAWHCNSGRMPPPEWHFVVFGAALHFSGWLVGWIRAGRGRTTWEWVIVPGSGALGGLALAWVALELFPDPARTPLLYVWLAAPLLLVLFLLATALYVGLASDMTNEDDREWWSRAGAWVLIVVLGWLGSSTLVFFGPSVLLSLERWIQGAAGAAGALSGILSALGGYSRSKTEAAEAKPEGGLAARARQIGVKGAAVLFLAALLVAIAIGTDFLLSIGSPWEWDDHRTILLETSLAKILLLLAAFAGLVALLGTTFDINKFSLHSMYGNRIVRAYMGASNRHRNPHPFTGFDPADNLSMSSLRLVRPFHVVNVALNQVHGENLAWQQRKAQSMTISPLHSGSWTDRAGYRRSPDYGGSRGISLGKAVAISGAAASPNMGYHSSPLVTFLMTLFNARLGWWLGNPGAAGSRTYHKSGPTFATWPLINEALGLTNDRNAYVYLSDGGHFENLALYEMILRRCHFILLSDAGCDPKYAFEDLGNALRKIRVDLGVPIEFDDVPIRSWWDKTATERKRCAVGRIRYSAVDAEERDGVLIYVKPVVCGPEPPDVLNYATGSQAFPHEPTSDQWFSESQFESYRALGALTVGELCGTAVSGFPQLVERIYTHHFDRPLPPWLPPLLV